jgi:hypothetical protein
MHIAVPQNGVLEIIRKVRQKCIIKFFVKGGKKRADVHQALRFHLEVDAWMAYFIHGQP